MVRVKLPYRYRDYGRSDRKEKGGQTVPFLLKPFLSLAEYVAGEL